MPAPPNVLLITTDQMRADHMGCAGNPCIRTPHLDRLAAAGVCLDRAYVSNPLCMPNRATIATGRLPRNHRCWSNGVNLPTDERTVADVLNERGYHTALLGKGHLTVYGAADEPPLYDSRPAWQHGQMKPDWTGPYYGFQECRLTVGHGPWGYEAGHYGAWLRENFPGAYERAWKDVRPSPTGALQCFTPSLPVEAHPSTWVGNLGCEYLRRRAADGRRFLAWVSFADPHHAFCPPAPFDTLHDPRDVVLPRVGPEALADRPPHFRRAYEGGELWEGINKTDILKNVTGPQLREIIARTYGMITLVDENIGRILRTLDETGLAGNTVVIFTSDHGDLMGDCGLIFKGPFLLEGLIRVPMIWRVPGPGAARRPEPAAGAAGDPSAHAAGAPAPPPTTVTQRRAAVPPGAHVQGLFNSCDIAPTVLALLGMDVPHWMDGLAQSDLVRGGLGRRDAAFVEFKSMYRPQLNLRTIITADRKLTHYAGQPYGELYDMTAPVPEARNLYADPAWAEERRALERRLLDEEIGREDPLLKPLCHA
jgi:arylsulfatase A-like enzyme